MDTIQLLIKLDKDNNTGRQNRINYHKRNIQQRHTSILQFEHEIHQLYSEFHFATKKRQELIHRRITRDLRGPPLFCM